MRWLTLATALAACSYSPASVNPDDDSDANTSDADGDGMGVDAMVIPCGYTELADATNNSSGGAEVTGLTFSSPTVLCGDIDEDHFEGGANRVDIDGYRVNVLGDTDVLIHLTAPGAGDLDAVVVQVLNEFGTEVFEVGRFVGDHATAQVTLPAGESIIAMVAQNSSAIATPLPYRMKIVGDNPAARCTKNSAVASFTEVGDGGGTANDMVLFDNFNNQKFLTNNTNDAPEAVTTAAGTVELNGTSAAINVSGDSYLDRDTFEIKTGPTTTQLSVRLNWAATDVDLDLLVLFPSTPVSFGAGLSGSFSEDEFDTVAVEPNQKYWIWVGADDNSPGVPAAYEVTVCGEQFTP